MRFLNEEVDHHHGAKAAGSEGKEPREMHAQQLEYLSAGARNLRETLCQGSVPGVMDVRKKLFLCLERLKENLTWEVARSSTKTNLQKKWGNKGDLACQKALDNANKFLEESRIEYLQ
jgi:hypothetical protein